MSASSLPRWLLKSPITSDGRTPRGRARRQAASLPGDTIWSRGNAARPQKETQGPGLCSRGGMRSGAWAVAHPQPLKETQGSPKWRVSVVKLRGVGTGIKMEVTQMPGQQPYTSEEFSAPPCLELGLPPLFSRHILESELETEVEFVSGGLGSSNLQEQDEEEEVAQGQQPRYQGELNHRKYQMLGQRCREMEQTKVEEDFGVKVVEALDSSWVSQGPDKLLPYPSGRGPQRVPDCEREQAPVQTKVEEDFGVKVVEALDSSWVSQGPDKLLPYPSGRGPQGAPD
ncbi:TCF3 fusion partner like protein [Myotis davidii]|uniref:TCF3 fusion partner like protein n=1 Tax=Myotis davidii TaxID=225400 RepID=L5M776_MYODS|nr:TCF3 fusion partner like protein [Myotis davidii]